MVSLSSVTWRGDGRGVAVAGFHPNGQFQSVLKDGCLLKSRCPSDDSGAKHGNLNLTKPRRRIILRV